MRRAEGGEDGQRSEREGAVSSPPPPPPPGASQFSRFGWCCDPFLVRAQ